ncbi:MULTISPECIES: DUF4232 domain-containing protein [unclassified Streptomyces]|uniref:DUF4232 domain-containing protein n=1 Tax=unclassified Streptomyces TaxID=2593676 RepID=UPI000938B4F5|nr:DUF4232 domain-containing protein [Streptomyces sp. TSRI0107]OKJ79640.1 hypothetical protein AMK31_26735 [Streptomyces sp. TSRI0107]
MRAKSFTATTGTVVGALAAALVLSGCGGEAEESREQETGGGGVCAGADIGVEYGPVDAAPAAGDTGNVTVTLTNRAGAPCTLDGFPAVELAAGDTSVAVRPDDAASARKLTLAEGGTALFTLTYTRGEAGGERSLAVRTLKVGLPDDTVTHDLPWSYGEVALKGEAEAEASVGPFQQPVGD